MIGAIFQLIFSLIIWTIRSACTSVWLFFFGPPVGTVDCLHCGSSFQFQYVDSLQDVGVVSSVVWSADGKYLAVGHTVHQAVLDIYDTKNWNLITKAVGDEFSQYPLVQFIDSDKDLILPRRIGGNYAANSIPPADDYISLEEWNIEHNIVEKTFYATFTSDRNSSEFSKPLSRYEQERASLATAMAVSSDGKYVAASVGTGVLIYDHASAQVIQNIKCESHFKSSFTPFTVR